MALRNQPYLPLYVQDFLTDEKLNECSAQACGVYIKLMCLMHKSDEYGTILLKQKDKQTDKQIKNFALKLLKHLPYPLEEIEKGIVELVNEGCLKIEGDKLLQKRMIRDNELSNKRSQAGQKGGKNTQFALANALAKSQANTEYEYESENINEDKDLKEERTVSNFDEPTIDEVKHYFDSNGFDLIHAENFYSYYSGQDWKTTSGIPIKKNWKKKVIGWMNNQKQFNKNQPKDKEIKKVSYDSPIMKELYGK